MRHKLRELRLKNNHTQRQVARLTGTTKEYYGLMENGKRVGVVSYWLRLQKAYKLTDAELWGIVKEGVKVENKTSICE